MEDLIHGRCGWCGTDELYVSYHDNEWGIDSSPFVTIRHTIRHTKKYIYIATYQTLKPKNTIE